MKKLTAFNLYERRESGGYHDAPESDPGRGVAVYVAAAADAELAETRGWGEAALARLEEREKLIAELENQVATLTRSNERVLHQIRNALPDADHTWTLSPAEIRKLIDSELMETSSHG